MTKTDEPRLWMPLAASGMELAGATLACFAAGYAIDRWVVGEGSIATAFGLIIGFILGMIRFIRRATQITGQVAAAQAKRFESRRDDVPQ